MEEVNNSLEIFREGADTDEVTDEGVERDMERISEIDGEDISDFFDCTWDIIQKDGADVEEIKRTNENIWAVFNNQYNHVPGLKIAGQQAMGYYSRALDPRACAEPNMRLGYLQCALYALSCIPRNVRAVCILNEFAKRARGLGFREAEHLMAIATGDLNAEFDPITSTENPFEIYAMVDPRLMRYASSEVFDPLILSPLDPQLISDALYMLKGKDEKMLARAVSSVWYYVSHMISESNDMGIRFAVLDPLKFVGELPVGKTEFRKTAIERFRGVQDMEKTIPFPNGEDLFAYRVNMIRRLSSVFPPVVRNKTFAEVMEMTGSQWRDFFADTPPDLHPKLKEITVLRRKWGMGFENQTEPEIKIESVFKD